MKNFVRLPALIAAALFLAGCYFDHPLTNGPSKDINTWILGVWECPEKDGKVARAMITPVGHDRYAVEVDLPGKKPRQILRYEFEGWTSRVGDTSFLTLRCVRSPGEIPAGKFLSYQIQLLDQNHFRLRGLQLDSPSSASSYELRKEVRRKLKDHTLYVEETTDWSRVAEVFFSTDGRNPTFTPIRNPTF